MDPIPRVQQRSVVRAMFLVKTTNSAVLEMRGSPRAPSLGSPELTPSLPGEKGEDVARG